jgi:hypothetical protein
MVGWPLAFLGAAAAAQRRSMPPCISSNHMLGPVSRLPPHGVGHIQQTDYKRNKPGDEEAPTNTRLRYKQKEDTQTPRRNRTDEPVENYPYTFQPIA